jgi:quinol monooxygenase YgiN
MSELLTLIARAQAKPGQHARLGQELKGLVGPTLAEPGCVGYDLHESNTEPGLFLFYETWKSDADLDAHFKMPHMLAFLAKVPELVEGPIELSKWTKVKA